MSTGLAYDVFGTPRPNEYFPNNQVQVPILEQRYEADKQITDFTGK